MGKDKFIHCSTRLYCNLLQAYKMFTNSEKIEKWLCDYANFDNDDFEIIVDAKNISIDTAGSKIITKEFEQKLDIQWVERQKNIDSIVEISFMNCSPRTKNCVEIHILHKNLNEKYFEFYQEFWGEALDALRYFYNKDWIIEDGDLTLTKLTGRSL